MALLPNMEPFCLGQPLNVGKDVTYSGMDGDPCPEYAMFTSDEESDSDVDI